MHMQTNYTIIEITPGNQYYELMPESPTSMVEMKICPVYKKWKLVELFIFQQTSVPHPICFRIDCQNDNYEGIYFGEYSHTGTNLVTELRFPVIWKMFYCTEHKCQSFRMYVPDGAKKFRTAGDSHGLYFEWG